MATNPTPVKKSAATAEQSAEAVTEPTESHPARQPDRPTVVGPVLPAGATPVSVTLSHHLNIDGTDYRPGAEVLVAPDYARRLRTQGYISRA